MHHPSTLLRRLVWSSGFRNYTLSRYPNRNVGVSRARQPPKPHPSHLSPWTAESTPREELSSDTDSQLWRTSQRLPKSNADEGLIRLLQNDTLVIERQIEMLNIFVGFEQTNKYSISNGVGDCVGFIAEEPRGFFALMARQAFATHRPFRAVIMDLKGSPVLWIRRPFAWINSRMFVQRLKEFTEYTPHGEPILDTFAEVQQVWHLWRRRYDLFIREGRRRILSTASEPQPQPSLSTFSQFAKVDSGFLAWHFPLFDAGGEEIAYISRAFRGFGREIFTDTGQYSVYFGPHNSTQPGSSVLRNLTLDERALILALAVNIDFDYFSRHSGPGSGGLLSMSRWD